MSKDLNISNNYIAPLDGCYFFEYILKGKTVIEKVHLKMGDIFVFNRESQIISEGLIQ